MKLQEKPGEKLSRKITLIQTEMTFSIYQIHRIDDLEKWKLFGWSTKGVRTF